MSWKEDYLERYKKLKEQGKSFFPYFVFKDTITALVFFIILCCLSFFYSPALEELADPTDTNYNPRPEWYFLFIFQVLKMFPGNWESFAAFFLPLFAAIILFLIPFLDPGPERHPLSRPLFSMAGIVSLLSIGYLTYLGAVSPLVNPIVEKDPLVAQGQRLYHSLKCAYCHQIKGKGGVVGPELDKAAPEETEEWLTEHFRNPQAVSPGSPMPKLDLLEDEIKALVAYMKSLEAGVPFTEQARQVFAENCAACHKIGTEGGDSGPDLTHIGSIRDKAYIKKYILEPAQIYPNSVMPGYKGLLTEIQIEELSRYLASLGS